MYKNIQHFNKNNEQAKTVAYSSLLYMNDMGLLRLALISDKLWRKGIDLSWKHVLSLFGNYPFDLIYAVASS